MKSVENIRAIQLSHVSINTISRNITNNRSLNKKMSLLKSIPKYYQISLNNQKLKHNQYPTISSQVNKRKQIINDKHKHPWPILSLYKSKSICSNALPIKKSMTESSNTPGNTPMSNFPSINDWLFNNPLYFNMNYRNSNKNKLNFYNLLKRNIPLSMRDQIRNWGIANKEDNEPIIDHNKQPKLTNYFNLKKTNRQFQLFTDILNMTTRKGEKNSLNKKASQKNMVINNNGNYSPKLFRNKSIHNAIAKTQYHKLKIITL